MCYGWDSLPGRACPGRRRKQRGGSAPRRRSTQSPERAMLLATKRFGVAALAVLAACGALAAPARAQFRRPGTVVGVGPAPFNPGFLQNRFVPIIPSVAMQ